MPEVVSEAEAHTGRSEANADKRRKVTYSLQKHFIRESNEQSQAGSSLTGRKSTARRLTEVMKRLRQSVMKVNRLVKIKCAIN